MSSVLCNLSLMPLIPWNSLSAIFGHFFLLIAFRTVCHHTSEWHWYMPLFHPPWMCLSTTVPAHLIYPNIFPQGQTRAPALAFQWHKQLLLVHIQNAVLPRCFCRVIHKDTLSHQVSLMYVFTKEPFACTFRQYSPGLYMHLYSQTFPWGQEPRFPWSVT